MGLALIILNFFAFEEGQFGYFLSNRFFSGINNTFEISLKYDPNLEHPIFGSQKRAFEVAEELLLTIFGETLGELLPEFEETSNNNRSSLT